MKKKPVKIGDTVIMPDPMGDDAWHFGNFVATVEDIIEEDGLAIVIDADGDFFSIEVNRIEPMQDN